MLNIKSIFTLWSASTIILMAGCGSDKNYTAPPINDASASYQNGITSSSTNISSEAMSTADNSGVEIEAMPQSLANKAMHLTITDVTSLAQTGEHPTEGTFIVRFGDNGTLVNEGISPWGAAYAATYNYTVTSDNTAENNTIRLDESSIAIKTEYIFTTPSTGTWVQNYNNNEIIYEGTFTVNTETYPGFAPNALVGLSADIEFLTSVSNEPAGSFPTAGIATHIYNTATTFNTDGSQVNTPNTVGTYAAEKLSLNVIRDSGFNTTFNDVYEIVYTFETLTSGTFTEDWGNGQILWTGVFNVQPIE